MIHQQVIKVILVEVQQVVQHLVTDVGLLGIGTLSMKLQLALEIDHLISLKTVNGNLSWGVDKNFQGADTGATEFDSSDMGPKRGICNYQERRSELDQFQIIGSWDNNQGLFMESLTSVDFGYSTTRNNIQQSKMV
jgi:hypothetical protein